MEDPKPLNAGTAVPIKPKRWEDAQILLDFAVEQGVRIAETEVALIRLGEGVEFEHAYSRLARRMKPVTAETLRATESNGNLRWWHRTLLGSSEAENWSRILWAITISFMLLTLGAGALRFTSGDNVNIETASDSEAFAIDGRLVSGADFCLPFLFGALGACAYLLRTCHWFTYRRTFDPRREGEYINRILLGFVCGGAGGLLFARYVVTPGEVGEDLSAAAIGFLCGYNNDFLFTAIERLAAAILPKVPPPPPPPPPASPPPAPSSPPGESPDPPMDDLEVGETDGSRQGKNEPDKRNSPSK